MPHGGIRGVADRAPSSRVSWGMAKAKKIKLRVASPCDASWEEMSGDEAIRRCSLCDRDVYELSDMSTEQVEAFLLSRSGLRTCVRFYQRADGTVLTSDCIVGKGKKRRQRITRAFGAAAISASAFGVTRAFQMRSAHEGPAPGGHEL